jgi:hypothetical protein
MPRLSLSASPIEAGLKIASDPSLRFIMLAVRCQWYIHVNLPAPTCEFAPVLGQWSKQRTVTCCLDRRDDAVQRRRTDP